MSPRCCPPPPAIDSDADPDVELATLAKALGHPVRVLILRNLLARDDCVVGDLVEQIPLAQSTISQHLKVLRDAGMIYGEVDGSRICYCADEGRIARLRELLQRLRTPTAGASGSPVDSDLQAG